MQRYSRELVRVLTIGALILAAGGCGGGKKTAETAPVQAATADEERAPEFDYEEFAPLPKVMTEVTLPMLLDADGVVEQTCFTPQDLKPAIGGFDFKATVEKNNKHVRDVILRWFVDEVAPPSLSLSDTDPWEMEVGSLTVMEVDTDKLRFAKDQECIQDETGWLGEGTRAVTTVIGAKFFEFSTKKPIDIHVQEDMVEATKEKELTLASEAIGKYKPALDDKDEQKLTKDGQLLFIGPGGVEIAENKMPPESERGMKEWTLESPKTLYFAFQTIPSDAWSKENKKKTCDTFLVWGDVTPRSPECDELKDITFTAKKNKKEEGNLSVELTYNKKPQTIETPYETTQKITLGNRIILWINVKKEEEGVNIRANSVSVGSD